MSSSKLLSAAFACMLSLGVTTISAAEEDVCPCNASLTLQTDLYSSYMFRGQNLYDGASLQPSVVGEYDLGEAGTLGGYVWNHTSVDSDTSSEEKFVEMDYSLYYRKSFDPLTLEGGLIWYTYPDGDDQRELGLEHTEEFYVKASLEEVPLTPTFTYFKDYREVGYNYYQLGFSQKVETNALGEGFNFTPYATFGFASNAERVYEDDGLETITIGSSFDLKLGDIAVVPSINYSFKVDDNTDNQFWFGTTFKYDVF